jgi:hypothetical protein
MAITIFDHLKNITTTKGEYLGDEGFNNYMINKFLSMEQDYIELVNMVQPNTWKMEGKHLYTLYRDAIPKQYKYLKYIKASKKKEYDIDQIEAISIYFEISKKEAKEYINMLSTEEVENITSQIKGK